MISTAPRLALVFDRTREDTLGVYFERAYRGLGVAVSHFWTREAHRIPEGYTAYLRIDHGAYDHDLPERLRPRILYAVDTHLPHSWTHLRRLARRYDLTCCAHRPAAAAVQGVWVPVGCDPEWHGPPRPAETRWDAAFIGTEGGVPRKFYMQALRERYPRSVVGHAPAHGLGAIYGRAAVGVNFSIRREVNMRVFEVLCAGALLVTNRLADEELQELGLREGEHYLAYERPSELWEHIDDALRQPARRLATAARGQAVTWARHTYWHRAAQIAQAAAERLGCSWLPAGAAGEARAA